MRPKLARPMTQKRLMTLVHYSRRTGVFTSRKSGKVLGSPNDAGYLVVKLGVKYFALHRLAWLYVYGYMPEGVIDHLDHDKQNNAIHNLREVSQTDNCKNHKLSKKNTSGAVGVRWNERLEKWTAAIKVDRKNIHLGVFDSFEEAVAARAEANIKYGFHENHGTEKI